MTVYSMMIFSHIYLDGDCIYKKIYIYISGCLLIHLDIIIQHRHQSSVLNKTFLSSVNLRAMEEKCNIQFWTSEQEKSARVRPPPPPSPPNVVFYGDSGKMNRC